MAAINDEEVRARVAENVAAVRQRVRDAANRAGRDPGVRLVAVTKYATPAQIRALYETGEREFAESRIIEVVERGKEFPKDIRWHLIGHLQRNKAKQVFDADIELVHSLDSLLLLEKLTNLVRYEGRPLACLLEFNIAVESQKYGFLRGGWREVLDAAIAALPHVEVRGLMCMAPLTEDPEQTRPIFRALRELRDEMAAAAGGKLPLPELSMGMTQDFEVAVEEGATIVRIGSALFDGA